MGEAYLRKIKSNGQLDGQFGTNGMITLEINAYSKQLLAPVDNGNKFVILYLGFTAGPPRLREIKFERYFANGQRDTSFFGLGSEAAEVPYSESGSQLLELADGKFLYFSSSKLMRFNADGSIDRSFNASFAHRAVYTEGGTPVVLNPNAHIATAKPSFDGSVLRLSSSSGDAVSHIFGASGALDFNGSNAVLNGITIASVSQADGVFTLRINSNATQQRVDQTVKLLTYANASTTPPALADITWHFSDADPNDPEHLSIQANTQVAITAVDSPAQLTINPTAVNFIEAADAQSTAVAIVPELTISDDNFSDPQTYSRAEIRLDNAEADDVLRLPVQANFSAQYSANTLTITAVNQPISAWQNALRSVEFSHSGDYPSLNDRSVSITLFDGTLASNTVSKTITVTAMNDSPQISVPTQISALEDEVASLSGISISDPDSGSAAISITISVDRGSLTWPGEAASRTLTRTSAIASINASLAGLTFLSDINDDQNATLTISVNDNGNSGQGGAKTQTISRTIAVTAVNDVPAIEGVPAAGVLQDQVYQFTPSASDIDNSIEELVFSIANQPSWAQFDPVSRQLSGTPNNEHVGFYRNIVITVSDGELSASLPPFDIEVVNVNDPPSISGSADSVAVEGEWYQFSTIASDPDQLHGQVLIFSVDNKPSWADFDETTGILSGTPAATDYGTYTGIRISVSDGEFSAQLPAFDVFVKRAPVAFNALAFNGSQAKEHFGQAVALFDTDQNGYSELIVGSPDRQQVIAGKTIKQAGGIDFITPASNEFRSLSGSVKQQRFGASIAVVADQDQDVIPDLIIGNPKAGKGGEINLHSGANGQILRNVLKGNASKTAPIVSIMPLCTAINPEHLICRLLGGVAQGAAIGEVVAVADVNHDGIQDLIVGLPQTTVNTPAKLNKAGTVIVYDGLSDTPIYTRSGDQAGELFGSAVAVNHSDQLLLVGSPMYDVTTPKKIVNVGRVQAFNLNDGVSAASFSMVGNLKNQFFGDALASVEQDLDGDGAIDWLTTQPGHKNAAQVLLFSGSNPIAIGDVAVEAPFKRGAIKLASGQDSNADEINDVAIGLPLNNAVINGVSKPKIMKQADSVCLISGTTLQ